MTQGRGFSAIIVSLCVFLLLSDMAHATTYVVGDDKGWAFNTSNWPGGKRFKAGDVLVFNYDPSNHDVTKVDVNGYQSCDSSKASEKHRSGHDQITLSSGTTYFICSIPGHCQQGMKIAIHAS
ncbi:basic blue protein-like [Vigna radiata var. radiata]|uniref:Basic blue protein n=1 Tax=Vigna radiata var. radiata TaxID=3916 RepID=A0A1S3VHB6_VIGRR|nr:basic blue protein-like [Vigna radiata var. radiata]